MFKTSRKILCTIRRGDLVNMLNFVKSNNFPCYLLVYSCLVILICKDNSALCYAKVSRLTGIFLLCSNSFPGDSELFSFGVNT